jgi:very-short-patch-repair endonuclease
VANDIARKLRNNLTPQEQRLWQKLRALRASHGFHFRRQAPIDCYIVDFVCFERRLVVEVDGGQHGVEIQEAKDRVRDHHLTGSNFQVIRVWNSDVDSNLDGVMEQIVLTLNSPPPRRASLADPPRKGEG